MGRYLRFRHLQSLFAQHRVVIAVASVFVIAGGLALTLTHATTPYVSVEPENGALSGVTSVDDATASGAKAVKFGGGSVGATTMTLAVNGSTKFQTMDGFGTNINPASWNGDELKPALDMLIDQNGSRIFRVVIEQTDWESANDDSDPNNSNWTGYYNALYSNARFQKVWNTIAYLTSKGIPAKDIEISLMGQGPSWMGGKTLNTASEDEWTEMVTSMVYYARNTAHVQFGMFSPNNEPDITTVVEGIRMNSAQYARTWNKVAVKLDALGMSDVRIIGPDLASFSGSIEYTRVMDTYPTLWGKMDHITGHTYSGSIGSFTAGQISSEFPGKNTWVSEFSVFTDVFSLLGENPNALVTWDGYDSVYQHAIQNGLGSQPGNDAGNAPALIAYDAGTKKYTARKDLYNFGQLFKWVTPGMQRVGTTSSKTGLQTFAFVHPTTGAVTIFGRNTTGSTQTIGGTLTGTPTVSTLHYSQTNSTSNMAAGADVPVSGGGFTATVPNNTVFTLTSL